MCTNLKLIFVNIILFINVCKTNQKECNKTTFKRFEEISSKLITIGDPDRRFPENHKKWAKWCRENKLYLDEKDIFIEKCLSGSPRKAIKLLTYSQKRSFKSYCKTDSNKSRKLISIAKCLNRNKRSVDFCYFKLIDQLLGAQNDVDEKKIPYFCCAYQYLIKCWEQRLPKKAYCDQDKVDGFVEFLKTFSTNIQNYLCGDYTNSQEKCLQLGLPPRKKTNQKSKSLTLTIINLYTDFKEPDGLHLNF